MATPLAPGFQYSGAARNRLSYDQVKRLAQSFGLPGDAIAQIAKGESGLYADVQQRDPGDRNVGYGLLQMTPNAWGSGSAAQRELQRLGGVQAMRDPVKNMAMARFLYKAAGNKLTPWYGTRYLTNRAGEGKLGPIDPNAAQGLSAGGANAGATAASADSRSVTTTTPGVDNRVARATLIQSFLDNSKADPIDFAQQAVALRDIAPTSKTTTTALPGSDAAAGVSDTGGAPDPTLAKGVANFEGKKVAGWIAPILSYARAHGWKGNVNSGFRSLAEQTRIYNSGVRPAARPGTSNHEGTDFPRGAIDVSDAATLASILKRSPYSSRLQWAGSKDPVHFSHPHGGSY